MAVIVELDDSNSEEDHRHPHNPPIALRPHLPAPKPNPPEERPNPNINGFSAVLSCYPAVSRIGSQLDLNDLDALSRTCRQFRANMLEFRSVLVKTSLHCYYEGEGLGEEERRQRRRSRPPAICVRDMVGECQGCRNAVCRNCAAKPPSTKEMLRRYRRICETCAKAPIHLLTAPPRSREVESPSATPNQYLSFYKAEKSEAFTAPAFRHSTCSCDTAVWLCHSCKLRLKELDSVYMRCWVWRVHYNAGDGIEGVECGREASCLASKAVEQEVDGAQSPPTTSHLEGAGYGFQEIEGVGGVVKKKAKRQVLIGAPVIIYPDERRQVKPNFEGYLTREAEGKVRCWCNWCQRIVPSKRDKGSFSPQPSTLDK